MTRVTGYLIYDEQWGLYDAPELKSCCLESHQIALLEGDFSLYSTKKPLTVVGVIEKGVLHPTSIQQKSSSIPYGTLGAALLICVIGYAIFKASSSSLKR